VPLSVTSTDRRGSGNGAKRILRRGVSGGESNFVVIKRMIVSKSGQSFQREMLCTRQN
jgi:hypothetical protein